MRIAMLALVAILLTSCGSGGAQPQPQPTKKPPEEIACFSETYPSPTLWHLRSAPRAASWRPEAAPWVVCKGDEVAVAYWFVYGTNEVTIAANSDAAGYAWLKANGLIP